MTNSAKNPIDQSVSGKKADGSDKARKPRKGGSHVRKAHEWSGGSKAAKGKITSEDRDNPNSSQRS
jgi:hypothetical protein